MKRPSALLLAIILILGLSGCSHKIYELPHDRFCYTQDTSLVIELDGDEREYIIDTLNAAKWEGDLSKCDCDFVFYTQRQEVRYHSECGAFNDVTRSMSMTVSEDTRVKINSILFGK